MQAPDLIQSRLGISQLTVCGDSAIYDQLFVQANTIPTLALFSSQNAPASILLAVHDLAQQWRQSGPVIISGFQAPVENEALTVLLRGPQPVVVCLARGMFRRIPPIYRTPLDEGRLLLISAFPGSIRRPTRQTAYQRNRLISLLAVHVLFAHAQPGSQTEKLAYETVEQGKGISYLKHKENQNLAVIGEPYCDN